MLRRYSSVLSPNIPLWGYAAFLVVAFGWVLKAPKFWVFLGAAACLLAIAALGLMVVVGWIGEVSLASAALVGTSVYLTGYMVRGDGLNLPFLVGLGAGVLVATLLHAFAALATAKLSGIYVMVLTLGLQVTIERTVFSVAKLTGGSEGVYLSRPSFLGLHFDSDRAFYWLCAGVLALVVVLLTLFRQSRHGRAMLLVRTNKEAAAAVGISPWRYKILAFAICGALLGLAGAMTAPLYRSPPTLLQYLSFASLFLLAVPVTAGSESLISVILVAFAFTLLPAGLEEMHLRMSPNIVGGLGLLTGTYIGARGIGGAVLDRLRERRENQTLAEVQRGRTVVLPSEAGVEPVVIDTVPAGPARRLSQPRRSPTPVGVGAMTDGEAVVAVTGNGLGAALSRGPGITLRPRPRGQLETRG
ncbi:MAG: branched-chain amino acid ABC transporter permease [Acidimicrobiia bacterium]